MDKTSQLVALALELAATRNGFVAALGPGVGNRRTIEFVNELRDRAIRAFGEDYAEHQFCDDNSSRFDFYFRDEQTVVEIALGLPNPNTEFEKDILKALVARGHNHPVRRLLFVSRRGAKKKCEQPARAAIIRWANEHHQLQIDVIELGGTARVRQRNKAKFVQTPRS
jgi:hypothetical protein